MTKPILFLLALCTFHGFLPAQSQSYIIAGQTAGGNLAHQFASPNDTLHSCFCSIPEIVNLDLDGNAIDDFRFVMHGYLGTSESFANLLVLGLGNNTIQRGTNPDSTAYPYLHGDTIFPTTFPDDDGFVGGIRDYYSRMYFGWPGDQDSVYLGVRFQTPQGWVLGWIQLRMELEPMNDTLLPWPHYWAYTARIIDWALGYTYVGIAENSLSGLDLYPVPATTKLMVNVPQGLQIQSWQVADITGKIQLKGEGMPSNGIDVSDLPSGLYIFGASSRQGMLRRKFLKE